MTLAGKCAIVTGPAKGMGEAVTMALAEAGADLALLGRDLDAIAPVARKVAALGRKSVVVACDVTDAAQVDTAVAQAVTALGRADILVNVAGNSGTLGKPIWENTLDEFAEIMRLNVTGCFLTMRAMLPA